MSDIEKTCENCEYEHEDIEGTHCRHCIHNAEEHFKPKEKTDREIIIDEVFDFLKTKRSINDLKVGLDDLEIRKYKEQLKAGGKDE